MKIILFDIDGTLVRAGGSGRKALNRAARLLYGHKEVCSELDLAGNTDHKNFRQAFKAANGRLPGASELARLERQYLKHLPYYVRAAVRRRIYRLPAGIRPLLRRLAREKRVLLGLGTGNLEKGARIKLRPSGFNKYFRFGGFGSDSPHRATLLKAAVARARRHLNGHKGGVEVFVVGDTPRDVEAGKKAGYATIAVGTGFSSWEALLASRPYRLARDFRGMDKWLKWFGIR